MGTRSLLVFVIIWSSAAFAKPWEYDLGSIQKFAGRVLLQGNRTAQLKSPLFAQNKIVFEDPLPRANWGHPAKLKVVGPDGQTIEEITVRSPPRGLPLSGAQPHILVPPAKAKITLDRDKARPLKAPGKYYAVLINGNASQRHWNDFAFFHQMLTQIYGYSRDNILIADSFHKAESPDLDGDGVPDIAWESTMAGIKSLFEHLKSTLERDSELLVVINDHGESKDGEASFVLNDGEVKATELSKWLAELPSRRVASIFQQCFGGGFVRGALGDFRIAMSASSNQEFSWATADLMFDEFLYHLTAALGGQTHEGKPVTSDRNGDGLVSFQEAFAYALAADTTPENPLLESYANSGFDKIFGFRL